MSRGNLIIVSGPSGAGKSALVAGVLGTLAHIRFSVSYTTRAPRGTERDGIEYFFVDRDAFQSLIQEDALLEWAEVHDNYYGTSRKFVDDLLVQGEDVILDIDVQGAETIRRKRPDTVSVFVLPPSYDVLRERLERRSLDEGLVIRQRLKRACSEIRRYHEYDYLIVNRDLGDSIRELEAVISGNRCRRESRMESAKSVLATFGGTDAENP
ncbi:MAG: guanylate kinase [Acidobacteria bacterium]|nr:guanylate kinase [Acidobacteriota bacterium]